MRKATKIQVVYDDGHVANIVAENEREARCIEAIGMTITGSRKKHGGLESVVIGVSRSKDDKGKSAMTGCGKFIVPFYTEGFRQIMGDLDSPQRMHAFVSMVSGAAKAGLAAAVKDAEDEEETEEDED